jgi:hypothetical protein
MLHIADAVDTPQQHLGWQDQCTAYLSNASIACCGKRQALQASHPDHHAHSQLPPAISQLIQLPSWQPQHAVTPGWGSLLLLLNN